MSTPFPCPHCGQVVTPPSSPVGGPPKSGTITGQVWSLYDTLTGEYGRVPTRKEVIQKGLSLGINYSTIVTQYQRVKTFRGTNPLNPPKVEDPKVVTQ